MSWQKIRVSDFAQASNCPRLLHHSIQHEYGDFSEDLYLGIEYNPLKQAISTRKIRYDATAAGEVAHDILAYILSKPIDEQIDLLNQFRVKLRTTFPFKPPLDEMLEPFIPHKMYASNHDPRLNDIVQASRQLLAQWINFVNNSSREILSIHTEKPLFMRINSWLDQPVYVLGRADVVVEFQDGFEIIDFKTGSFSHFSEWSAQLSIYGQMLRSMNKSITKIGLRIIHPDLDLRRGKLKFDESVFNTRPDQNDEIVSDHCQVCPLKVSCEKYQGKLDSFVW